MENWHDILDELLKHNEQEVLQDVENIIHKEAMAMSVSEF